VDVLYAIAGVIFGFLDSGPPLGWSFVAIAIAAVPCTLLHELGHAIAARRLLDGDVEVVVGTTGKLVELRLGQVSATISALSHPLAAAGTAGFDDARATARDVACIALAGPLASALGLLVSSVLFFGVTTSGVVHDLAWAAVLIDLFGVLNLIPSRIRERGGSFSRSDGLLVLHALRALWALR
jgi:hypothetical protein